MALALVATIDFNAGTTAEKLAKVAKFYCSPKGLGSNPANLRLGSADGVSFMESSWGVPPAGMLSFFTAAARDAANPAVGTYASCYDADPAKHGLFQYAGAGDWGARLGPVQDVPWFDGNHTGVYGLGLLVQAWASNALGTDILDGWGPNTRIGMPFSADLRNAEFRWTMAAVGLRARRDIKLFQHFQTQALSHPLLADGVAEGGGALQRRNYVNALVVENPISDQLMLGQGGPHVRNAVEGVANSGFREVVVKLSTRASAWQMLGGRDGRSGLPGDADRAFNYVVEPPATFLQHPGGVAYNAYMVAAFPVTDEASAGDIADADNIRGQLRIRKLELWA